MEPDQMSSDELRKYLAYYRKRIDEDPRNVEARLRLATVYREIGRTPKAVDQYEKAAELLKDKDLALEAIAACEAILELDPASAEAKDLLARLYARTPDAADESVRVAEPVDEPSQRSGAQHLDDELTETDEFEPDLPDDVSRRRPAPDTIEQPDSESEQTRVGDYSELPADARPAGDDERESERRTVELTPEERERREGFSREEMEDLLTTIDLDDEDILEEEDLEPYEPDGGFGPTEPEDQAADFELGADLEVDESAD